MLFGFSVGSAGDIDADGRADVVIGAPAYTLPEDSSFRGAAFV